MPEVRVMARFWRAVWECKAWESKAWEFWRAVRFFREWKAMRMRVVLASAILVIAFFFRSEVWVWEAARLVEWSRDLLKALERNVRFESRSFRR